MLSLPPLSLYIHIPWCVRKCPYCDFNSHQAEGELPEAAYVDALIRDLDTELPHAQGRKLHTIFIGGGTPSLFSAGALESVLAAAESRIGFDGDIEITLEANPGTLEQGKFRDFRMAGINRLSIGVQSFDDLHLQQLGRIHNGAAAIAAATAAREAGFERFNLDLMHGLPGQSPAEALTDLTRALALGPDHLSWYQLTIEPNTVFWKRPPTLPRDDVLEDIQEAGQGLMAETGFRQYEVSAYARPGHESRHNLNYWAFGDYLGIGAGAHGKITLRQEGEITRTTKTRTPADYLSRRQSWLANQHPIAADELPLEFMMNALRLNQGVPRDCFNSRTGLDFSVIAQRWRQLEDQGLVRPPGDRLATTPRGHRFLDTVLASL